MSITNDHIVLFDLDGTIVDSAPGVAWSLNKALEAEGRSPLTVERVKDLVGKVSRGTDFYSGDHSAYTWEVTPTRPRILASRSWCHRG